MLLLKKLMRRRRDIIMRVNHQRRVLKNQSQRVRALRKPDLLKDKREEVDTEEEATEEAVAEEVDTSKSITLMRKDSLL